MRVLWFSSFQLPAVTGTTQTRGTWQEAMRRALETHHPEIELGIASYSGQDYEPFQQGNATYYNIHRKPRPGKNLQLVWNNIEALFNQHKHYQYVPEEMRRFVEIVRDFRPDVIMMYGTENPFGLMSAEYGAPSLLVIQGFIAAIAQHQFDGLAFPELLEKLISRNLVRGSGIFNRWLYLEGYVSIERAVVRSVKNFSGRTAWDQDWLKRLNPGGHYYHCDEIMSPAFYENLWSPDIQREKSLYTTSSDALIKGSVTLVRAIAELKRRGRTEITLRVAGANPGGESGEIIKSIVQQNKLGAQVQLLGRVPAEQIIQEMQSASLFVLPSHIDNSPNSLCEAMLLGMPCIASDAGGIPSLLADGEEGLIYPHKNIAALADHIEWMLDHPAQAAVFGRTARATARVRHDPKRNADRMVEIYKELMSA